MDTRFIIWFITVAAVAVAFIVRLALSVHTHRLHAVEIGNEGEEFFVPGDDTYNRTTDYEEYE